MSSTTDFISPFWKSTPSARFANMARAWLTSLACVCLLALTLASTAFAQSAVVTDAKIEATEEGYQLNADFDLQLTSGMQDAVRKGVPLYFIVEVEITQARWYWFDRALVRAARDRRVSFAPLTEQYRITTSGVSQTVMSFDEVKRSLSRVRSWTLADKSRLTPGARYDAAIRIRLDNSRLPKPFQLDVLVSKEWNLASEWHRFSVTP